MAYLESQDRFGFNLQFLTIVPNSQYTTCLLLELDISVNYVLYMTSIFRCVDEIADDDHSVGMKSGKI